MMHMIPEHIVTKEMIRSINEQYGGHLLSDAEIDSALCMGKGNAYRKVACLLRALLVGHPFTDGNKRTALVVALTILEACDIAVDDKAKERLVAEVMDVASQNIENISTIERRIRYAVTKN